MATKTKSTDVFRFRCANADRPSCLTCPREFLLSVEAIECAWRDESGHAVLLLRGDLDYRGHKGTLTAPFCPVGCNRFVHTSMPWSNFMALVDYIEGGDIVMSCEEQRLTP
jgi:hypothetical protein